MKMLGAGDASLLGLGTQMLSEVAAGILIGLGLDYMLGTEKRWLVVGAIVGVVVAMWTVIRTTIRLGKQASPRGKVGSGPGPRQGGGAS
jgi:F0F1-type ATP synthase assembly protein I